MTTTAPISFAGLSSQIDSSTLIDQLVAIETQRVTLVQQKQAGLNTQISGLASIISQLNDVGTAATNLSTNKTVSVQATGSQSSYTLAPTNAAGSGAYSIQVNTLARNASVSVDGLTAPLVAGTFSLTIDGANTNVAINAGDSLSTLAARINSTTNIPVTASVINDGSVDHLVVTQKTSGYTIGGMPSDALQVSVTNNAYSTTTLQPAVNATFSVNGLPVTRRSNSNLTDVIANASLNLRTEGGAAETVSLASDNTTTQANIQKFIDAYNTVMTSIHNNTSPAAGTSSTGLINSASLRNIQSQLQSFVATGVNATGSVRTLADIGIATQVDGTLALDATTLQNAVATNPDGVNNLFSKATTGLGDVVQTYVNQQTAAHTGYLQQQKDTIAERVTDLDQQIQDMQTGVDNYKARLTAQFAALESTTAAIKNMSSQLDAIFFEESHRQQ